VVKGLVVPVSALQPAPAAKPVPQLGFDELDCLGIPLLELSDLHCRWPIGDPKRDFGGFCGRDGLGSLCDHHKRIVYRPVPRGRQ
jgi:hypothetical protein